MREMTSALTVNLAGRGSYGQPLLPPQQSPQCGAFAAYTGPTIPQGFASALRPRACSIPLKREAFAYA